MSGGSFDYAYGHASNFACELANKLDQFDKVTEWGDQPNLFPPEVLAKLREVQETVAHAAFLMKEVEWLYSGDTGSDTFMEHVAEIEAKEAV